MTKIQTLIGCVLSIVICELAGAIGALFTINAIPTWYAVLQRPPLTPPSWIFGPVWTVLYALMGIAAFLVWKKQREQPNGGTKTALYVFLIQLLLNAIWTPLFFGLQNLALALGTIFLLWIMILLTIVAFQRISRIGAYLLIPYVLWVTFAMYLNAGFWFLNR